MKSKDQVRPSLLDMIPGYRQAVERETTVRDEAYADAPEFLCGIEVRPLTLASFALLNAIASPFVRGTPATAADVAQFFFAVSPEYQQALWWRSKLEPLSSRLASRVFQGIRLRFLARLRPLNSEDAMDAIDHYLDAALMDAPKGTGKTSNETSYWSMLTGLVGWLALETGWSEAEIMKLQTKRAFQYLRLIVKRNNPDKILFNPSDAVRGAWLQELNAKPTPA